MRYSWWMGGVALCALAGCSSERAETRAQRAALGESAGEAQVAPVEQARPEARPGAHAPEVTSEDFVKRPDPKPQREVHAPDWAAAARAPGLDPGALGDRALAELKGSPVPLLVPDRAELLEGARITTGEHWAAASLQGPGHTVYLQGTRVRHVAPKIELDEPGDALTRKEHVVSRTHGVVTLAFERFGVGYHIDVECAAPMEDERCTEGAYVRELYDALAVAPGGAR